MKLSEIIDTEFINVPDDTDTKSLKKLGTGVHASVVNDEDPFMVRKSQLRTKDDPDAYYHWVKAIAPYISSNPYLPRVYVVNDNKSDWGMTPTYKMEKLVDYTQVPLDVLISLYYKEVPNPSDVYIDDLVSYTATEPLEKEKMLWKKITQAVLHPGQENKHIDQAINIVYMLINKNLGHFDLHPGNFMIRMGKFGPQLVITDPIA